MFTNCFGEEKHCPCGLLAELFVGESRKVFPIPLISVNVNATLIHCVAQIEVEQIYENKEKQPIEAIYYFPINPEGAVTNFEAELDGKAIKGIAKANEEAEKDYIKAVQNQTTAFLGGETKADIFKIKVGFLKPRSQAKVVICYVTEVKNEPGSNTIRFYIPTTIAPRYVSRSEPESKSKSDIESMTFSSESPAPLSLKVDVFIQGKIKNVESPTHQVKVEWDGEGKKNIWQSVSITLDGKTTDMDRDFVVNIEPEKSSLPVLYSEKSEDGSTAMMLHFIPSFKLQDGLAELIFVLDRSGSMDGSSIELARDALLVFLHSLPSDCYFNIVGFGDTFHFLFNKSVKYSEESLKSAISHAEDVQANLGGTEILEPLLQIYGMELVRGYRRNIFVITDGRVSDTERVISLVKENASKASLFSLGIGNRASHELVEGIAKAGEGTSAFVSQNERVDIKVLNQLKNALQPSLNDIKVEWDGYCGKPILNKAKSLVGYNKPIKEIKKYQQSPREIPPIFDGSQLILIGLFQKNFPQSVVVKAMSPDGELSLKAEHSPVNEICGLGIIHRLAAIKLVRELELNSTCNKYEIIDLACKYGIASKYTSFIAIAPESKEKVKNWNMKKRQVPSQIVHGCHGGLGQTVLDDDENFSSTSKWHSFKKLFKKKSFADSPYEKKLEPSYETGTPSYVGFMSKYVKNEGKDAEVMMDVQNCVANLRNMAIDMTSELAYDDQHMDRFSLVDEDISLELAPREANPADNPFYSTIDSMPDIRPRRKSIPLVSEIVLKTAAASKRQVCMQPISRKETVCMRLIRLQYYNGCFPLDEKLAEIIGKSLTELKDGAEKYKMREMEFATALAIAFFTRKLQAEWGVFDLIAEKAKKWLNEQGHANLDDVLKNAEDFLLA